MRPPLFLILSLGVVGVVATYQAWQTFFDVEKWPDCSPLARRPVELIRAEPSRWTDDGYCFALDLKMPGNECWGESTISFWVANGAGNVRPTNKATNDDRWKALRLFGSSDQRYVYLAYKQWHRSRQYEPTIP